MAAAQAAERGWSNRNGAVLGEGAAGAANLTLGVGNCRRCDPQPRPGSPSTRPG